MAKVQAKNRGDVQVKAKFRAHLMWKTLIKWRRQGKKLLNGDATILVGHHHIQGRRYHHEETPPIKGRHYIKKGANIRGGHQIKEDAPIYRGRCKLVGRHYIQRRHQTINEGASHLVERQHGFGGRYLQQGANPGGKSKSQGYIQRGRLLGPTFFLSH